MLQNANQFSQVALKGQLDLSIMQSGVITGIVSADETDTLYPGDYVNLDTVAGISIPSFAKAVKGGAAFGLVIFGTKQSSFVANDRIEVALLTGSNPVIYMEAAAAIAAQAYVEDVGDLTVQTLASEKQRGIALDGAAAAGDLIRVILTTIKLSVTA